ncbi:MAG: hypothetical protein AB1451_09485 [Nitrospirota bacterium]
MRMIGFALVALVGALVSSALAQEGTTNMDILIQKVKADKKLLVAANMDLTDAEGKAFWPIYDAYQKDLQAVNERLGKAIAGYAEAYAKGPVPNDTAKKVFNDALAAEEAELKLKQTYLPKLEKAVSAAKAVRYLQIENKIRAAIRYELADQIPLVD